MCCSKLIFGRRFCASEEFQHHGELTEGLYSYMLVRASLCVCFKLVYYFIVGLRDLKITLLLFLSYCTKWMGQRITSSKLCFEVRLERY